LNDRTCPGHPRLCGAKVAAWLGGTTPARKGMRDAPRSQLKPPRSGATETASRLAAARSGRASERRATHEPHACRNRRPSHVGLTQRSVAKRVYWVAGRACLVLSAPPVM